MSKKSRNRMPRSNGRQQPWRKMGKGSLLPPPPELRRKVIELTGAEPPVPNEVWLNDRYHCSVYFLTEEGRKGMVELSIHAHNRRPIRDWRHMQRIKNDVMGAEREGVELYPAESRKIDAANEYHMFVLGDGLQFDFGDRQRAVMNMPEDLDGPGRQRPHEDDEVLTR